MVSILEGSLAQTIGSAASFLFLDATLYRDTQVASSDPAEPGTPTTVPYTCKAIEEEYSSGVRGQGLVGDQDVQILVLASTLAVEPASGDRIAIRSVTYTVVPSDAGGTKSVRTDPARATWMLRCSR